MQPTNAYFGQKDISQCILIKNLVKDLNFPVAIKVCETLREDDGLAMSSRNTYLQHHERSYASVLFRSLQAGKLLCDRNQSSGYSLRKKDIVQEVRTVLQQEKMVSRIEYISVASPLDMTEIINYDPSMGLIISSAIRLGSVRLIDNILVGGAIPYIYDS